MLRFGKTAWVLEFASFVFFMPFSSAQDLASGILAGHVRGPGGVSVPGATVMVVNKQTGARKVTWTDESGNYTLPGLPPATYKLEVSLLGFEADVREPVPVNPGKTLTVNISLLMAAPGRSGASTATKASGGDGPSRDVSGLSPEIRDRLRNLGADQGDGGGDLPRAEANVRFSDYGPPSVIQQAA
jgi:hypothetical protein